MIITFCGQKGGTGKTTMSFLVAETLARAGKRVAVRDEDPQASVSQIVSEMREAGNTKLDLWDRSREGEYDFVIVDTLPQLASRVLIETVKESDRIIMPLKPSMVDIRATLPAIEMVKNNTRPDARAYVLWNMVKQGTRISRELETLQGLISLPVLKTLVPERVSFTYATLQGFDAISAEDRSLVQQLVLEFLA